MLRLIKPTLRYQETYREALTTLNAKNVPGYAEALADTPAHVKKSAGDKNYVQFWLMGGKEYIGSIGIEKEVLSEIGRKMHWYIERPVANRRAVERQLLTLGMKELTKLVLTELLPRQGAMRAAPLT